MNMDDRHGPKLGETRGNYTPNNEEINWLDYHRSLKIPKNPVYIEEDKTDERYKTVVRYGLTYCMTHGIAKAAEENADVGDFAEIFALNFESDETKIGQPFEFKSYAPKVFKSLRDTFSFEQSDYLRSITMAEVVRFQTSSKSGGFFFFTHDGQYLIKTASSQESTFFLSILKDYYEHMIKYADTSMLVRFVGFYQLKVPHVQKKTSFIVMRSVYSESMYHPCQFVYDLKGSKHNRRAKEGDAVKKDLDIIEEGRKFHIGDRDACEAFKKQLRIDVEFLEKHNIMDYSLLIGVHDQNEQIKRRKYANTSFVMNFKSGFFEHLEIEAAALEEKNENRGSLSKYALIDTPNETYYCAIIDILQPYNIKKKGENLLKSTLLRKKGISAVPAKEYAERFVKFISGVVTEIDV